MERTQLFDPVGEHKLYGMKAAFGEIMATAIGSYHRDLHSHGDEIAWWGRRAIDPMATSRMLWVSTRRIE
jgi:hypothetical protein